MTDAHIQDVRAPDELTRWLNGDVLALTTDQIGHSLEYLHNATNWGLVLVSGSIVAALAAGSFPSAAALYALLITLVFAFHFMCRSAKGYINVIRYSIVQRILLDSRLSLDALDSRMTAADAIRTYVVRWSLPVKRADVFVKVLAELGYGYLIGINIALIVFALVKVGVSAPTLGPVVAALILVLAEVTMFVRSPYMRVARPNPDARRDR